MHRGATQDRARPRAWNTDWLLLRDLSRIVRVDCAARLQAGDKLVDFGCGDRPYLKHFAERKVVYFGADLASSADLQIGADGRVPLDDGSVDGVLSIQVL